MLKHRLFYDRDLDSIEGRLTLLRIEDSGKVTPVFKRLRARSGQWGYTGTSWTRGKSPVPFGEHKLATNAETLWMEPVGTPFFRIGSTTQDLSTIKQGVNVRKHIGLHMENQYAGSAGCIVIVRPTDANQLFSYLEGLSEAHIDCVVL